MDFNLTTPALFFSMISLLMLAYTNRFLALAALIRDLYAKYQETCDEIIIQQIGNLRYRVMLIKYMQAAGVASILGCVVCMFVLFLGWVEPAKFVFGISLILLVISLFLSLREVWVSVGALNLQLHDLEEHEDGSR
jgi:hypothetical protein